MKWNPHTGKQHKKGTAIEMIKIQHLGTDKGETPKFTWLARLLGYVHQTCHIL